jgi:integrase/recombinase XerD
MNTVPKDKKFEVLVQEMKLRNFSKKTIKAYLYHNKVFLDFIKKSAREISGKDIRNYLLFLIEKQKSSSTINLIHNALAFYYGKILRKKVKDIAFQKREQKIKTIASQADIKKMLAVTTNLKHKLLISFLYASGLRCSEVIKVKICEIDFDQRTLLVRQGKGKKDRITILSNSLIKEIKEYSRKRVEKSEYLFTTRNKHMNPRTVEAIVTKACKKAKITKKITPHSLRHSFTTHHMAIGTKTEYIQEMLGHKDIRTTRTYERISKEHLINIKHPHDLL